MAEVVTLWMESLQSAYGLARGERRNELAGRYVKSRDGRGLHPYSEVWGRIRVLEDLEPVLANEAVSVDPVTMRRLAHEDANGEFLEEIREAVGTAAVEEYIAAKRQPEAA